MLSAFFDTYRKVGEKRAALLQAMQPLYRPMLYTSLTSAAGFASLVTYINKVWQDLMVFGMLKAVLGSFAVVFVLLPVEFRSLRLGALAMLPLSVAMRVSFDLF